MQGLSKEFQKYHWNVTLDVKYNYCSLFIHEANFFIKVADCPFVEKFQHFSRKMYFSWTLIIIWLHCAKRHTMPWTSKVLYFDFQIHKLLRTFKVENDMSRFLFSLSHVQVYSSSIEHKNL